MGPRGRCSLGLSDRLKGVWQVVGSVFPGVPRTALASGTAARGCGPWICLCHRLGYKERQTDVLVDEPWVYCIPISGAGLEAYVTEKLFLVSMPS